MVEKKRLDQLRYALPPDGASEKLLTGIQALVLAPIMMAARDRALGRATAGYVSGYRGSPLAGLDKEFARASDYLSRAHVHFRYGMNEDFAASALYGTQMLHLYPKPRYDGVFGMWYGKGPGVDRTGDVFKHANAAGTAPLGGVLAVAGDDHTCKSSTMPHQSDQLFRAMRMPYLVPSDVDDILRLALRGWEISRRSGSWLGFIVVADLADATARVSIEAPFQFVSVPEKDIPADGLNIRWPDDPLEQEVRIHEHRLSVAGNLAALNGINVVTHDCERPELCVVASGKSYRDTIEALRLLGLSDDAVRALRIRVLKIGMPWPLSVESLTKHLSDPRTILVVEEKQNVIEDALRAGLYQGRHLHLPQPDIVGKRTVWGGKLFPETGEVSPAAIAIAIFEQLRLEKRTDAMRERVARLRETIEASKKTPAEIVLKRVPYYCSGCPHNTSTKVIPGSVAGAGIGCHYMAVKMDPKARGATIGVTPMGQEGTQFIGLSDFTETDHFFQNLGDGTYFHSGSLAIRAAVAAKVSMTFKILFNDAVAMTGGQKIDGTITVPQITQQAYWEGVRRIAVVAEDIGKWRAGRHDFAPEVTLHPRSEMESVQRELRAFKGVSVLVYDQTCAAEKRRRRKAGKLEDPVTRTYINPRVCEGCGDCGKQSNCLSVEPLQTEYGTKRKINQSTCNKDYSCVDGFCPSFVLVDAPTLAKAEEQTDDWQSLARDLPAPQTTFDDREAVNILFAGIGGTGIVTVAQTLSTAAFLAGFDSVLGLDITGMSQKAGYVSSHVRLQKRGYAISSAKIPQGETTLLIAADLVSSVDRETLTLLPPSGGRGVAVVANSHRSPTAQFIHDPDLRFPKGKMEDMLKIHAGTKPIEFVDATELAERLFGDSITSNILLLGYAYQAGLIPVGSAYIEEAIRLNGVQVKENLAAFALGRLAKGDPKRFAIERCEAPFIMTSKLIERNSAELERYQDAAYAKRYLDLVTRVENLDLGLFDGDSLTRVVAENYFKLMAYKDEYEVSRLYADPAFTRSLDATFESTRGMRLVLAPPLFARKDKTTGLPKKSAYGSWIFTAMRVLAKLKFLRGTPFDPFGYTEERKTERALITEYEALVRDILANVSKKNRHLAQELLSVPEMIRGFGHVKAENVRKAKEKERKLRGRFQASLRNDMKKREALAVL